MISGNKGAMFCFASHPQKEAVRAETSTTLESFGKLRGHFGKCNFELFAVSERCHVLEASTANKILKKS